MTDLDQEQQPRKNNIISKNLIKDDVKLNLKLDSMRELKSLSEYDISLQMLKAEEQRKAKRIKKINIDKKKLKSQVALENREFKGFMRKKLSEEVKEEKRKNRWKYRKMKPV